MLILERNQFKNPQAILWEMLQEYRGQFHEASRASSLLLADRKTGRDEQYLFKKLGFISESCLRPVWLKVIGMGASLSVIRTSGMFPLRQPDLSRGNETLSPP